MRQTIQAVWIDGTTDANGNASQIFTYVEVYQGDELILDLDVKNPAGTLKDLTGYVAITTIRGAQENVLIAQQVSPNAPTSPPALPQVTQEFGRSVTVNASPSLYTWDTKVVEVATGKEYTIVPPSPLRIRQATTNTGEPVTAPANAVQLVGVPTPIPTYNADLVLRSGALKWRQHERAKVTFTGAGATLAATWPDFQTRVFEARAAQPVVATDDGIVGVELVGVTSTGCTVEVTDPSFSGDIDIDIAEVV